MKKIRKGDEVIIIAGKDGGKIGKVLSMVLDGKKVIVEGVNEVKKHVRPNPVKNIQGGIQVKNLPIDVSNVAIYNADSKKADRVGFKGENGKKIRVFKSTGQPVK